MPRLSMTRCCEERPSPKKVDALPPARRTTRYEDVAAFFAEDDDET